jgi:plasmid stabilization system protein ParE
MRKIEWTPDGEESFNEIVEYYCLRAGENVARNIFNKINEPPRGRAARYLWQALRPPRGSFC